MPSLEWPHAGIGGPKLSQNQGGRESTLGTHVVHLRSLGL